MKLLPKITYTFVVLTLTFSSYAQNTEERKLIQTVPNNSLENPASYAEYDQYKVAKAKNALVYGRDYIFEGHSPGHVDLLLIEQVDPYRYLHQFKDFSDVQIELQDLNLTMILFARKRVKSNVLNENN
ncbi:MAG: hypothetical protein ACJAUD_001110 [Crocinitomicaceae bacterium]|jgi:hypothetical protein